MSSWWLKKNLNKPRVRWLALIFHLYFHVFVSHAHHLVNLSFHEYLRRRHRDIDQKDDIVHSIHVPRLTATLHQLSLSFMAMTLLSYTKKRKNYCRVALARVFIDFLFLFGWRWRLFPFDFWNWHVGRAGNKFQMVNLLITPRRLSSLLWVSSSLVEDSSSRWLLWLSSPSYKREKNECNKQTVEYIYIFPFGRQQ